MADNLKLLRAAIDVIDAEILAALSKRANIVQRVKAAKIAIANELKQEPVIHDQSREDEIIQRIVSNNDSGLSDAAIDAIFRAIIAECRNLQVESVGINGTIAVQGVEGSHNDLAWSLYSEQSRLPSLKRLYLVTSDRVVNALIDGSADYGIVAIYNNQVGFVKNSVNPLQDSRCQIFDSITVPIHHCLLAGTELRTDQIKSIVSHPQALKQCEQTLRRCYPHAELVDYENTAKAAVDLASGVLDKSNTAVIASRRCMDLYNLCLIQDNMQDSDNNATTFLILTAPQEQVNGE